MRSDLFTGGWLAALVLLGCQRDPVVAKPVDVEADADSDVAEVAVTDSDEEPADVPLDDVPDVPDAPDAEPDSDQDEVGEVSDIPDTPEVVAPTSMTIDEYCAATLKSHCKGAAACGWFTSIAGCTAYFGDFLPECVATGGFLFELARTGAVSFDETSALACVASLEQRCDIGFDPFICAGANMSGTTPAGSTCTSLVGCESGARCEHDFGVCSGTCALLGAGGAPCENVADCADGFVCAGLEGAMACTAAPGLNDACLDGRRCGDALYCDSGVCRDLPTILAKCQHAPDETCLFIGTQSTGSGAATTTKVLVSIVGGVGDACDPSAGLGGPLTAPTRVCAKDLRCDESTSACTPLSGNNVPCGGTSECRRGLYCASSTSTCTPKPPEGAACGEAIGGGKHCGFGLFCDVDLGATCRPKKAGGETCASHSECAAFQCASGKCTEDCESF